MVVKGSKTVDGKETKAENEEWHRFSKQQTIPFVTVDQRIEDAFRSGFRIGRDIEVKKAERKAKKK